MGTQTRPEHAKQDIFVLICNLQMTEFNAFN